MRRDITRLSGVREGIPKLGAVLVINAHGLLCVSLLGKGVHTVLYDWGFDVRVKIAPETIWTSDRKMSATSLHEIAGQVEHLPKESYVFAYTFLDLLGGVEIKRVGEYVPTCVSEDLSEILDNN